MRSDVLNVNSGSLSLPPSKGIVKIESKLVPFTASSANIDSGAMSIPGHSIIIRLTAVVRIALAQATATVGVSAGTSAKNRGRPRPGSTCAFGCLSRS